MGRASLEDLVVRATGGLELDRKTMLKASTLYALVTDPYWLWCEYHAPEDRAVDEENEYDRLRMAAGVKFEEDWVRQRFPDAVRITPEWGFEALKNTLRAIQEGVRVIHQPQLWLLPQRLHGRGDVLVRVEQPSLLGNYSYAVFEAKKSKELKKYHALQAAVYHRIISAIQGCSLERFTVALPGGDVALRYDDFARPLDAAIETWEKIRSNTLKPDPPGIDKTDSPWRVWANEMLNQRMDLTLLPDVGPATRDRIRKKLGVNSIKDLYNFTFAKLVETIGRSAGVPLFYNVEAYRQGGPVVRPGNRVTIPKGSRATFALDFETADTTGPACAQPDHCYLAGVWDYQAGKFVRFLAHGPGEEAKMFEDLIAYVGDPDGLCIQTWTDYEVGVIRGAVERHPHLAGRLEALAPSCVDLKEALKSQVHLPVPTWSIKHVGPALGFRWRHSGFGAFDSMAAYWKWLETGDDSQMQKVLDYHEDDVKAMEHIARSLDGLV